MTLAESRGIKGPKEREASAERAGRQAHPGPVEYIKIGSILAVITAVEVGIYYIEAIEDALVPILIVLSALKFSLVVMWFMHLKFDNRLFSWLLVGGLALIGLLLVVVLSTLGGGLV
jgi:cytochrome c oxidase subunit 4